MQLAMVGLGRMGANLVRRLVGDGHTCVVFDVDPAATDKLIDNLALSAPKLKVVRCADAAEAIQGADIITTITADKANATIVTADMIVPGVHLNAVGGDCPGKTELAAGVLERASVFVEFEPQSRIEGELQQMPAGFAVCELWRVLAGEVAGRRDATEVTLFDSVGFALEDYASLRMMRDYAREMGMGRDAGLIPDMVDPKNLFGYMTAQAARPDSKVA